MAGEEDRRHHEGRREKGMGLEGDCEEGWDWKLQEKHLQEEKDTHKKGTQVCKSDQDWQLSS